MAQNFNLFGSKKDKTDKDMQGKTKVVTKNGKPVVKDVGYGSQNEGVSNKPIGQSKNFPTQKLGPYLPSKNATQPQAETSHFNQLINNIPAIGQNTSKPPAKYEPPFKLNLTPTAKPAVVRINLPSTTSSGP